MEMEASSSPYLYRHPSSDFMHIDDLLDFSNQDIFFDSSSDGSSSHHYIPPVESSSSSGIRPVAGISDANPFCSSFSDDLCVPCDDVAQLEWLSQFVEDSFSDVPFPGDSSYFAGTAASGREASVPGRARSKRSRAAALGNGWVSLPSTEESDMHSPGGFFSESGKGKGGGRRKETVIGDGGVRKCTHCATEKTPQWRTGPLGPKSLCNACGVRYKSGRLVPEYRPAASPTFVLTQHSNSHRKVMELRRQKELMLRQGNFPDFKVC